MVDLTKKIVYGIVSGVGDDCGAGQESDVFTNVANYIDFIEDELKYQ